LKLEPLMTYRATLKPPVDVGPGPFGTRRIFDVTGGSFEGPRLRGQVVASGGDWILLDAEGVGRLDVRATFETDDGARLYVQYHGVIVMNQTAQDALAKGAPMEFGDTEFFTTPRIETGDARYAWLNRLVTVAEGRVVPGGVEYRVFALRNG
jgi:hypothetical protein